jgi:hypothetical protein
MASILAVMFAGIVALILHYHILPAHNVTAVSQVAELTFGRTFMYYYIQVTTMFVLYLAANTAYNGLPPLLSILARDGYMPRYLSARGDRLTFHNGIFLLSAAAAFLIVAYHGNTEHLISLYALGVFLSFTIAQTGMVIHWRRERSAGWPARAFLNGLGAVVTGMVVLVIVVAKFYYGAWVIILAIPFIAWGFKKIHAHYQDIRRQLALPADFLEGSSGAQSIGVNYVIVPVAGVTRVVQNTISYARSISDHVTALHVSTDEAAGNEVRARWQEWNPGVELVVINSPYRTVMSPIIDYIDMLQNKMRLVDFITVVIPEFETRKWWHRLLHNQTGWILRTFLTLNKNVVITVVPYHLHK